MDLRKDVPAWIYALASSTLDQLLHGGRAEVGQVVGARARDDGVPDDGLVRLVHVAVAGGPLGRHVDEHLFRVPREQRREVGVERELDYGIFLLLGAVVVRPALDSVVCARVSDFSFKHNSNLSSQQGGKSEAKETEREGGREGGRDRDRDRETES
jgi:hypothetical protein